MKSFFVLPAVIFLLRSLSAQGQELLQNPGFEEKTAAWETKSVPCTNTAEIGRQTETHGGEQAAHLATQNGGPVAIVQKSARMPPGIYELTVWCKGKGKLGLFIRGNSSRPFAVAEGGWHQYSLAFELTEPASCAVEFTLSSGDVLLDDASLKAADEKLAVAWKRQQDALRQFYHIPAGFSAQRPAPAGSEPAPVNPVKIVPIQDKVVFHDPRYDNWWNTHTDQIAAWFEERGFAVKGAKELAEWMRARIEKDAYGSVAVMAMGLVPELLVTPVDETCLLRRYLDAGGRMVWTGNVALYIVQGETGGARGILTVDDSGNGMTRILGVTHDPSLWTNATPQLTEEGSRWGLTGAGLCLRAVRREEVTCLAGDRKAGDASIWLKTTNPKYPLSGFIASVFALDGGNVDALEDFYRLAVFSGEPVTIPPGKPKPIPSVTAKLLTMAGGMARRTVVRGETVTIRAELVAGSSQAAEEVSVEVALSPNAPGLPVYEQARIGIPEAMAALAEYRERAPTLPVLYAQTAQAALVPGQSITVELGELETTEYPVGDYRLAVKVARPTATETLELAEPLAICPQPRRDRVYWGIRCNPPSNPYRLYPYLEELKGMGFDLEFCLDPLPLQWDGILRNGQTFIAASSGACQELVKDANGQDIPNPWAGGKPGLPGLAGQAGRDKAYATAKAQGKTLSGHPAFARVFEVNDDYSARAGWDYNPENLKKFKAKTGRDAPRPPELLSGQWAEVIARPPGIVPDDDAWLRWNEFLCRDVFGGFNDAQRRGYEEGCPGSQVWEVPGGALWPLFMPHSSQYPPMNFGREFGLNAIGWYTYLGYWAPTLGYAYWSEIGHIGNRDLTEWVMPDTGGNARHYIRNVAHLLLAGGTKGIVYFIYDWLKPEGRKELAELGALLDRHGAVLYRLKPDQKKAGLLIPFSETIFRNDYPLRTGNGVYNNLLMAHVDAEPFAEEEIEGAAYQAVLLAAVKHLRGSSVKALEQYIGRGGTVLCDRDCEVPMAGAKKLEISFMTPGDVKQGYANPGVIQAVREALAPYGLVSWDSPEMTTVIRPFASADGVRYVYAVHVDDNEEFTFWRTNVYEAGQHPVKPAAEIETFQREHGMERFLKDTEITVVFDAAQLPEGGQIVDVYAGKVLRPQATKAGKLAVKAVTRRFGGVLLAFLPSAIEKVRIARTAKGERGQAVQWQLNILDAENRAVRGIHPVRLTLKDPAGTVCPELTGYYAAESGRLSVAFTPPRQGRAGKWRLEATELLTGQTAKMSISIR